MADPRKPWQIDPKLKPVPVNWKKLLQDHERSFLTDNQLSAFIDPNGPGCEQLHFYPLPFPHRFLTGKWDSDELVNGDCLRSQGPALDFRPKTTTRTFLPHLITRKMRSGAKRVFEKCAVSGNTLVCTWDFAGIDTVTITFALPYFAAECVRTENGLTVSIKDQVFVALSIAGTEVDCTWKTTPFSCALSLRPQAGKAVVLGLTCGYDRETTTGAAAAAACDPQAVFAAAEQTWDEWFTRAVPRFSCSDKRLEKLYYYQASVTRANLYDITQAPFSHPYTCPWKTGAVWQWSWNTPMNSIAERWLNDKAVGAGGNLLMLDNGGALNLGTYLHPLRQITELRGHNDYMQTIGAFRQGMPPDPDLPVLTTLPHTTPNGLLGAWEFALCSGNTTLLADLRRLMTIAEEEFSRHELPSGLYSCSFVDEFDYSLRLKPFIREFRKGDPGMMVKMDTPFIAPDYNCFLYALRERITAATAALGDAEVDTEKLRQKNAVLKDAINRYLWDEETGFYYDVDPRTMKRSTVKCIAGFAALFAGIASPVQARRLVGHLTNPAEFGTPYPCPSVALDTPEADPSLPTYGGDCLLTSGLWFTVEGLVRYGYRDLAAQYILKAVEMLTQDGPSSSYSHHSGTGRCNQAKHTLASQSVILTDLICKYIIGIVPGPNATFSVDPLALAASGIGRFSFGPYRYCDKIVNVEWSRSRGYRVSVRRG